MKQIKDSEMKTILLNILIKVDRICRDNELTYFLGYGTLLGAIRHKGFIPWDDDIDIIMPRSDYNKLITLMKCEKDGLRFLSFETDPQYIYSFGKICDISTHLCEIGYKEVPDMGVYVDVFPIDNQGKSYSASRRQASVLRLLNSLLYSSVLTHYHRMAKKWYLEPLKFVLYPVSKLFGTRFWIKSVNNLAQKYNNRSSKYCGVNAGVAKIYTWEWTYFTKAIEWDFEGYKFLVPQEYDAVLKTTYGDYLQLPPIEERVPKHNYLAYFIETTDESDVTSKVEKD